MEQEFLTRREHEEFARRMESENARIKDENDRQNKRIGVVEESVKEFNKLAMQIERIAVSIQQMTEEISKQGARLEQIESKPAKRWDALTGGIIGAAAAAVGAAIMAGIIK